MRKDHCKMKVKTIIALFILTFISNIFLYSQEVDFPDVLVHFKDSSKEPIKGKLLMLDEGVYRLQTPDGRIKLNKDEIERIDFLERTEEQILESSEKSQKKKQKAPSTKPEEKLPEGDIIQYAISQGVNEEDANRLFKEIGRSGFSRKDREKLYYHIVQAYRDGIPVQIGLRVLNDLMKMELGLDFDDIFIDTLDSMRMGINPNTCLKTISVLKREDISGSELTKLYGAINKQILSGQTPERCINIALLLKRIGLNPTETLIYFNLLFLQSEDGLDIDNGLNQLRFLKKQNMNSRETEEYFMLMSKYRKFGASFIDIQSAFLYLTKHNYTDENRKQLLELIIEAKIKGVSLSKSYQALSDLEKQNKSGFDLIKSFESNIAIEIENVKRLKENQ